MYTPWYFLIVLNAESCSYILVFSRSNSWENQAAELLMDYHPPQHSHSRFARHAECIEMQDPDTEAEGTVGFESSSSCDTSMYGTSLTD